MQVFVGGMPAKDAVLDRGVAIAAIDPQNARMVLVAEGDGLDHGDRHAGAVRGAGIDEPPPEQPGQQQEPAQDTRPGDDVRSFGEELWHPCTRGFAFRPHAVHSPPPRSRKRLAGPLRKMHREKPDAGLVDFWQPLPGGTHDEERRCMLGWQLHCDPNHREGELTPQRYVVAPNRDNI